jgi:phosphatidate cytidylyltransferase
MAQLAERPPSNRAGLTNLQKRILSAAVLLPVVIAAIYFGHPYFTVLIALFAGAAGWEWARIVANPRVPGQIVPVPSPPVGRWGPQGFLAVAVAVLAVLAVGSDGDLRRAVVPIAIGVIATIIAAVFRDRALAAWNLAGIFYVTVPAMGLVLIRTDPEWGRAALIWIITLVVAADTGGYLVGRTVGGPKLAPRISPNKTWSGLGGAVAGAALAGLLTGFVLNHTNVLMLTLISAVIGLLEQGGDLVESAFKRHFGVKDTSQIIPGHGGVLDRVDGLLAVAVAVLVINLWAGGSVLAW